MTKLPLHRLMAQLQAAGFDITARAWYRVEIALSSNQELLYSEEGLEELGYILGPLLCHNDKQQALFRQIYQQYLNELPKGGKTVIEEVKPPKQAPWWLPAVLAVGLLMLANLALNWYVNNYGAALKLNKYQYEYDLGEGDFELGDTIRLINRTAPKDTAGKSFYWYITDNNRNVIIEHVGYDTMLAFNDPVGIDHRVQFIVRNKRGRQIFSGVEESFRVFCKDGPKITNLIQIEGERLPGRPLQFSVETEGLDFEHRWYFETESIIEESPSYTFDEPGTYRISVEVVDTTNKAGFCTDVQTYSLEIKDDSPKPTLVSMPPLMLEKDPDGIEYTFPVWVYLLGLLIPLLAGVFWLLWYYQRKNFAEKKKEERQAKLASLKVNDKAPYQIPFENRQSEISKTPLQFSMANVLRRRQEGTRQILDVPKTIQQTVEGGGYLDLQFRYNTKPTDYLFLIDQASAESHGARLFVYLTETLRDQDVHVEYWIYRTNFDRFWNPGYQGALTLEQLYKNYSDRKLIVFGDAEELLDLNRSKDTLDTFESWKYRLLVTPRPLASWSSKEKQLYRYFPLFPANLQSLMEAVRMIEREWEPEDLPTYFKDWKAQLERKMPEDPDSDIRWRQWAQYKGYLKQHPELLPWLKALVVHPELRWDLTIAIGKAVNAPVTFDNLLILSRIPAFDQGAFPVKVWREIWPQLDLEQEWAARRRVKAELAAISAEAIQGSYAEQEVETDLALQNFALEPYNPSYQDEIRLRLENGQIGKLHLEELDKIVERQTDTEISSEAKRGDRTSTFLRKQDSQEKPPVRTPYFWWSIALTALTLITWISLPLINQQALGEYFMDENGRTPFYINAYQPEFRRLNNQAVDNLYLNATTDQVDNTEQDQRSPEVERSLRLRDELRGTNHLQDGPPSLDLLRQALDLRPDYELAQNNLEKLYYMIGQEHYQRLEKDTTAEQSAYENFRQALTSRSTNDSTDFFALHGLASIQHTLFRPDSACVYVDTMRQNFQALLQKYAGDLIYLDNCEQEEAPAQDTSEAAVVSVETINPFKFYVYPKNTFSPLDNSFGMKIIRSFAGVSENTSLPDWVSELSQNGVIVEGDTPTQQYAEDEINFQFVPPNGTNNYALLFGADDYIQHPELAYPIDNTEEMKDALQRNGFRVEQVLNFSADEFRRAMRSYRNRLYSPEDQLIIYYAGYIYRDENEDDFIWPINKAAIQQNAIERTSEQIISADELNELINAIPCQRMIVIVDGFDLQQQPGGIDEQNITPPNLDNTANIAVYLNGRENSNVQGLVIDEIENEVVIAAPYFPIDENNPSQSQLEYRVQLQNMPSYTQAAVIDYLEQDSLLYLRLPKPAGFDWSIENLHQEALQSFQPALLYQRLSPTQPFMEGTLSLLRKTGRFWMETEEDHLGGNLVFVDGKIAGLALSSKDRRILYGYTFNHIYTNWQNIFQAQLDDILPPEQNKISYELPPDFPMPEMVPVRGGTFTMGCTEEIRKIVGDDCEEDETPHQVRLDDYQMATTEVTFAQYDAFCEATGREKPADEDWGRGDRPVMRVTWYDAIEFCNWLSRATGREPVYTIDSSREDRNNRNEFDDLKWTVNTDWQANGYRLPTEAEWEYAARERGRDVVFGNGKNVADPAEMNFDSELLSDYSIEGLRRGQTVPVGSLNSPNNLGLHDMSGNVWEWCWDWYGDYPTDFDGVTANPKGGTDGSYRVSRGGSWFNAPGNCRAASRNYGDPTRRDFDIGFRLALSSR